MPASLLVIRTVVGAVPLVIFPPIVLRFVFVPCKASVVFVAPEILLIAPPMFNIPEFAPEPLVELFLMT